MKVLQLIAEVDSRVAEGAPFGTRWRAEAVVHVTAERSSTVAAAARIDARGRRREQYWCDGIRVDRAVLLRLTCPETECPHVLQVRAQWQTFHRTVPSRGAAEQTGLRSLMKEVPVAAGNGRLVARPARFPCFTPCPHHAHPPLTIEKTGYDLFEEGTCLGGGVTHHDGFTRPRIPTVRAAEAYVLARQLESLAVLEAASTSSRRG